MGTRPVNEAVAASPFSRLATTHACSVAADTCATLALAGSLFFSISPAAARGRVALYLALTVAPFAVVAPLVGPFIDRVRGGPRLAAVLSLVGRALVCGLMARHLDSVLLFPESFALLALSKGYSVARSALVPAAVDADEDLVQANARLALIGVLVGFAAAGPAVAALRLGSGSWALGMASAAAAAGAVAGLRLRGARAAGDAAADRRADRQREREHEGEVSLATAAMQMAALRAAAGFLTFLVAFSFRRAGAPSWWFGIVLAASLAGSFAGAVVSPWLRRLGEERTLLAALGIVVVTGLAAAYEGTRVWAAVMAAVVGMGAAAAKLAFDAIVQRDAPVTRQGRTFARYEARFQLVWVAAAIVPVVAAVPRRAGFLLIAAGVAGVLAATVLAHRRR